MGKAFDVSANIGFDGSTYFCKRCGKAGYERATQVRGHLAMCPGTLMRKGVETTSGSNHLQPVASDYNAGLSGGQLPQPVVAVESVANPLATSYEQLANRVAVMENHYNHVMGQINQPQYHPTPKDFFSQHRMLIILGLGAFLLFMMSNQSGQCSCSSGQSKGVDVGNLGTKTLTKLVDTGITKGVAALFK